MDVDRSDKPTTPTPKVQQPKPQALPNRAAPSAILVSSRQKGNPILNHVKLVPWEYADIPADYVVGATTCALFLSLKYHRLHPEYIYSRIRLLAGKYNLRIVLVMVDIPNHEETLKELSKTSIVNNVTLILCWSAPEAAHYLELFKSSENAQPTAIRSQQAQSYRESVIEFITAPRILSAVPGWGEKKVRQWSSAVREDFRVESTRRKVVPIRDLSTGYVADPKPVVADSEDDDLGGNEVAAEEILLASSHKAHELETEPQASSEPPAKEKNQQEESMSEGIMDALAKLRKQDG
ncbi:hypothetical protein F66182_16892 [Fusarium sp. NRRL 66182]|nr:hypothetical protein F66182_16892 [Fusarium sp. NRRL 66182]